MVEASMLSGGRGSNVIGRLDRLKSAKYSLCGEAGRRGDVLRLWLEKWQRIVCNASLIRAVCSDSNPALTRPI